MRLARRLLSQASSTSLPARLRHQTEKTSCSRIKRLRGLRRPQYRLRVDDVRVCFHRNTITNIEIGKYAGDAATLAAIEMVLRRAGVEFIDKNGGAAARSCESGSLRRANANSSASGRDRMPGTRPGEYFTSFCASRRIRETNPLGSRPVQLWTLLT